ncbi:hypothetical protein COCON_G00101260 [Conger conger]|uniref:Uncharacterized protein n=1 Tax=Conger conger TaxID=82655 RepID=A0A9Q1DHR8_CONCO|nr:hypothetical protein COCON_G00101260 [Conger conger]
MAGILALQLWRRRMEEEDEDSDTDSDSDEEEDSDSDEERRRRRRRRRRMVMDISETEEVDSRRLRGQLGAGPFSLDGEVGWVSARRSFRTPHSSGSESRSAFGASAGAGIAGVGRVSASAGVYSSTRMRSDRGRTSVEYNAGANVGIGVGDDIPIGVGANVGLRVGDRGEAEVSAGVNVLGLGLQAGMGTRGPSLGLSVGPVKMKMLGF